MNVNELRMVCLYSHPRKFRKGARVTMKTSCAFTHPTIVVQLGANCHQSCKLGVAYLEQQLPMLPLAAAVDLVIISGSQLRERSVLTEYGACALRL
jgi:hypothetical protein